MDLNTISATPEKTITEKFKDYFIEFFETLVVIGAIFALIYLFIAQFHKVSGESMIPTFHDKDFIITEKVSYRFNNPQRGDIIVLKNPNNESEDFIKRIIALPGDEIKLQGGFVYINGQLLQEPYLPLNTSTPPQSFLSEGEVVKAGENQYFVFGDNRSHSSDSREWGGVPKEKIVGKVFFRYWPPNTIGLLN